MSSDKKSAVADFYLPRSSVADPDRPSPSTPNFSGSHGRMSSAGYNQTSFLHAGREEPLKGGQDEEEAWDIYADFNNAGPRYSSAQVQGLVHYSYFMNASLQLRITCRYQQLPTPNVKGDDTASTIGPVEMVTVPAFGPEWGKSEMKDMTKAGKREKKNEGRRRAWKEWSRDQRGLCGSKWLTRRVVVFILFGLCVMYVLSVLVSFFTIYRMVLLNGVEIQHCDNRSSYDPSSSFLCVQQ
jgi:hypothetical protein